MKAVVLAYHNIGCVGLEALLRHGFDVQAVFTHKDDPGERIWFNSVAELAAQHHLPAFAPADINHPIWRDRIREMQPDIIFSFYYRQMVKQDILEIPLCCLNLHLVHCFTKPHALPGQWVLVNGERENRHDTALHDAKTRQWRYCRTDQVPIARMILRNLFDANCPSVKLLDDALPRR